MAKLLGKAPNQVPTNADLGTMAFQDREGINVNNAIVANLVVTSALTSNAPFAVVNSSANVFYAAANGNVGVGTNAPTQKLVVNGPAARFVSSGQGDLNISHSSLVSSIIAASSVQLALGAGGSEYARVTLTGNVGIGNTAPAHKLSVNGTTYVGGVLTIASGLNANGSVGTTGQVLTSNGTSTYWSTVSAGGFTNGQSISVANLAITGSLTANGSTGTAGQVLLSNGTATYWGAAAAAAAAGTNTQIQFNLSGTTTGADIYYVAGNTGLGNSTPDATLAVTGTANVSGAVRFGSTANISGNVATAGYIIPVTNTGIYGNVYITATADVSGNSVMRVQTQSGYMEVGSRNTSYAHFGTDRPTFYFDHKIEVDTGIKTYTGNNYLWNTGLVVSNGNITVGDSTVNSSISNTGASIGANSTVTALYVAANGNVGLSNTTPSEKLVVGGNFIYQKNAADAGGGIVLDTGSTAAQISQILLRDRGTDKWAVRKNASNDFDIYNANTSATNFFISGGTGNVGIGNTSPAVKLVVAGSTTLTSGDIRINAGGIFMDDATNTGESLIQKPIGNTTQSHRISISNLGGPSGIAPSAFWNGLHLTSPGGIANSTLGNSFPRLSMFYTYSSNAAPTDLTFNMQAGNDAGLGTSVRLYSNSPTGTIGGIDIAANNNVGIGNTSPNARLQVTGTANVSGNVVFGQDLTVVGNLTVSGTTTYINTTNLNIGDNIITLNADVGAITPTENAGIEVNRGNSSNNRFMWNESRGRWIADTVTPLSTATYIEAYGNNAGFYATALGNSTSNTAASLSTTDAVASLFLDSSNSTSTPSKTTYIELKAPDYRGSGIVITQNTAPLGGTNAYWYVGKPYTGAAFQIGYGTAPDFYSNAVLFIASNTNIGIGNNTPGSKFVIQGGAAQADANTTAGIVLDLYGAVLRIGDSVSTAQTYANGVGFKIADTGNVHYSMGQIGGKFVISDTSADANALYPATRTDIITANNTNVIIGPAVTFNSYTLMNGGVAGTGSLSLVTSATTANQVVNTQGTANWRVIKYLIQVTSGSSYQSTEIVLMHDGTNVYKTEYGQMYTGAVLATFDADINSGNVRLLTTPTNAVTTYKGMVTFVSV